MREPNNFTISELPMTGFEVIVGIIAPIWVVAVQVRRKIKKIKDNLEI